MMKKQKHLFAILLIVVLIVIFMSKIKNLSPRLKILPAEKELELQIGQVPLGSRQGGLSMFSNKFKRGYGDAVFGSDENGIWLGKAEYDSAPFRVDMDGNFVATSATITGFVEDGEAAADVNNNVTTISGGKITANTVTATQMNVSQLSAIAADIGTITAGSLTASSGVIVGGITIVSTGITVDNNAAFWFADNTNALDTLINIDSGNTVQFVSTNHNIRIEALGGNVTIVSNNAEAAVFKTDGGVEKAHFNDPIKVGGVNKSAIVPYKKGYRALYCLEAPEVWFMDFCDSKETVSKTFLEVTTGEMKFIKLDGGGYQVWRRRKGSEHLRFEKKTKDDFDRNNKFWATPL